MTSRSARATALANGAIAAGDFDTWDLQRVEVLRGPQGTLYGAGSEGGLLKYVTNPPDPTKFAAAFELGDEDVAHGGDGTSYKAMVNLPVAGCRRTPPRWLLHEAARLHRRSTAR